MKRIGIISAVTMLLSLTSLTGCLDSGGESQLQKDVKTIAQYIQDSGIAATNYVLTDASGVQIVIHNFGTAGPPPHPGQTIQATYTGKLLSDGSTFDFNFLDGKIEDVKPVGLAYGILDIMNGTSATIYVPSSYGYGSGGTATVPANSILVYDIVLEDVTRTASETQQFTTDTTAIVNYLADSIPATKNEAGIWYRETTAGTGISPVVYDNVKFQYKVSTLASNGTKTFIEQGTIQDQSPFTLIDGLKVGLPLMSEGGKATFYIPSGLGYRTVAQGNIPANSNLVFEIELQEVTPLLN